MSYGIKLRDTRKKLGMTLEDISPKDWFYKEFHQSDRKWKELSIYRLVEENMLCTRHYHQ